MLIIWTNIVCVFGLGPIRQPLLDPAVVQFGCLATIIDVP